MAALNDTFTAADGTLLTAHAADSGEAWTALTGNFVVRSNRIRANATTVVVQSEWTPAGAEYDIEADFHVHTTISQSTFIAARIQSSNTYVVFGWLNGTGWTIGHTVSGSFTNNNSSAFTLVAGTTYHLRVEVRNGTKRLYVDDVLTCSTTANTITDAGKVGFRNSGGAPTDSTGYHWDNLTVTDYASATLIMPQLPDLRIFQRSTKTGGANGKGTGTVPVPVTVNAPITSSVKYRLRDAETGGNPVVQDWTVAHSGALSVGAATISCPDVPAGTGWYYLDLMPDDDTGQIVLGTSRIMVGRIISLQGQSQAARQFGKMPAYTGTNASLGVTISPYCSIYARCGETGISVASPAWEAPADGGNWGSTFASEFLRRQVAASGVNCAMTGHSQGSTATGDWLPDTTLNNQLRGVWDAVGGFETWMIHQGGNDAGDGVSQATFESNLDAIVADAAAHNAVLGAAFDTIVCAMGTRTSGAAGTIAQIHEIRRAGRNWATVNGGQYVEPHDVTLEDAVHQGQPGNITLAHHFHRAALPGLGLSGSNAGPAITGARRAPGSTDIVLSVALPSGASALVAVGSPAPRFVVYPEGALSGALSLDGSTPITVGTDTITLRLASDPGNVVVDVYALGHPDPSGTTADQNMIYDDHVDGDGITNGRQIAPTIDAVAALVAYSGSAAVTMEAMTASGAGGSSVDGSATIAMGAMEIAASGVQPAQGAASIEMGGLVVAGAGNVQVSGAAEIGMGEMLVSGGSETGIQGSGSITLGTLTCAGAGSAQLTGAVAITLGAVTEGGTGSVRVQGALAITFGPLQVSGESSGGIAGAVIVQLPAPVLVASGSARISGLAAISPPAMALVAVGSGPTTTPPTPIKRLQLPARNRTLDLRAA
ncbi:hypothetical protein BSL82_02350 [Tardibacter chloracetimidivorans]|uniref:Uncharacterized protein n=1 Tax=Tardibacter chloracetimidivorans TaxID=1921510 RepID=A0A1L3ZRN6_9SPHN|nr:hypothetical protein [Tardibacter chloracetimidivorans]API58288.1 hypothetical protein BSL82_02350 [Tardibacter chloracetimidivorans]